MKLLKTIKEQDVYPEREEFLEPNYFKHRNAVRIILLDSSGNIALNYYPPKEELLEKYGLPGGGVKDGEDIVEGLRREILEETGQVIGSIKELGKIIEYGVSPNLRQETFGFAAVSVESREPVFTEKEISNSLQLVWKTPDEALRLINAEGPSFAKFRSLTFLDAWLESK